MSNAKEAARLIGFRFKNHREQTDGFKWDYSSATDEDVIGTTPVLEDTIKGLSGPVLKTVKPKYRSELRKQIAYLIGLRQRQAEAWAAYLEDCKRRTDNVNNWLEANKQQKSWA